MKIALAVALVSGGVMFAPPNTALGQSLGTDLPNGGAERANPAGFPSDDATERLKLDQERLKLDQERLRLEKEQQDLDRARFAAAAAHRADEASQGKRTLETWSTWFGIAQSLATILGIVVGAAWALQRFRREREAHPHIDFSADIALVEERAEWLIVELVSIIENKGKVQHRMGRFEFSLSALFPDDKIDLAPEFGDQVRFPHNIAEGSWLPKRYRYFFIEPQTKAKYSYIARIPKQTTSVMLHSWFDYSDGRHSHSAECTMACAQLLAAGTPQPSSTSISPIG